MGTLRESAMSLVGRHVPKPTAAKRLEGLRLTLLDGEPVYQEAAPNK